MQHYNMATMHKNVSTLSFRDYTAFDPIPVLSTEKFSHFHNPIYVPNVYLWYSLFLPGKEMREEKERREETQFIDKP